MATYKLFLLPGDGIGPEVMTEVEKVADFLGQAGVASFEIEKGLVGGQNARLVPGPQKTLGSLTHDLVCRID